MFIFPMAGLSRRFTDAGYKLPKYMLSGHGKTLFAHAVGGFSHYFKTDPFIFVVRDVENTPYFVQNECKRLGIRDFNTIVVPMPTGGQAETVAIGLRNLGITGSDSIDIFNIDTFHKGFRHPNELDLSKIGGYLEVFKGSGDNWSYVKEDPKRSGHVLLTTEKEPISNLCCTGLYNFTKAADFLDAFDEFKREAAEKMGLSELYIAPIYNILIRKGFDIRYNLVDIDDITFCGTPVEYEQFIKSYSTP